MEKTSGRVVGKYISLNKILSNEQWWTVEIEIYRQIMLHLF